MTGEHLDTILKNAQAKAEKDGFQALPDGTSLTFYAAHDGVSLTVARVEAVKSDGELLYARTAKRETYTLVKGDVFAVAMDGAAAQQARRAGFGA